MRTRLIGYWRDEQGQAMTEWLLIIGLISIPIWVAFKVLLEKFLQVFISKIVGSFTRG